VTSKKIKRRLNKISLKFLWPLLPAILLIGLTVLLGRLQAFNLKKISCHLDNHQCSLEFESFLVGLVNQNIFKLKKSQVSNQLLEIDHNLSDIKIKKTLPNSLSIDMKKRIAVAKIIAVEDLEFIGLTSTQSATIAGTINDKYFYLDKSGEIYERKVFLDEKLPIVLLKESENLKLGVSDIGLFFSNLISTFNAHYVNFEKLAKVSKNIIIIKTSLGPYSIFDQNKSIVLQAATLQFVLSNIKIEEAMPIKIDLRFDKPILTY